MKRILVVDDDPLVSMSMRLTLERHGFAPVLADGGVSGLLALDQGPFDVMIIDIFMPYMRGFESVRVFHQRAPTVPLIAISGYAFAQLATPAPDFLRMAIELGATRCLRKPFAPAALIAAVTDSLADVSWRRAMTSNG
ncbi:MAG: response regulator [Tardiphaga sp.]